MPHDLSDQQFLDKLDTQIPTSVTSTKTCIFLQQIVPQLQPLPLRNVANIVMTIVRFHLTDKKTDNRP